jgi:hypothetical protein
VLYEVLVVAARVCERKRDAAHREGDARRGRGRASAGETVGSHELGRVGDQNLSAAQTPSRWAVRGVVIETRPTAMHALDIAVAVSEHDSSRSRVHTGTGCVTVGAHLSDDVSRLPLMLSPKRAVTNKVYYYKFTAVDHGMTCGSRGSEDSPPLVADAFGASCGL